MIYLPAENKAKIRLLTCQMHICPLPGIVLIEPKRERQRYIPISGLEFEFFLGPLQLLAVNVLVVEKGENLEGEKEEGR